ncbi:MAG: GntR family transcriptional regulator [Acholeplasmataceae bacterium]|nr:GntR family transcriptional regulator [Acholeplasmataceae bacterium]
MQSNLFVHITIDRRSTVVYNEQIKESIKALILDQVFYYKTLLPNPKMIANHLNIDYKYAKLAYDQLIQERYIRKIEDDQYEVSYFELTNYFFDRNVAIYDAIIALGLTPSIKCVEKKVVTLSVDEQKYMGFNPNDHNKYFYINRLYLGNMQPIMILENYLPMNIFPEIDQNFVGDEPLNAYLDQHYNIRAKLSHRTTQAVNLTSTLAKYLNERKNAASICSTNRVYDQNQVLIDFGRSHTISSYYFQALISKEEISEYYISR